MYKALPSPEPTVLIEVNHYIVHLACTKKMQIWVEVSHKVFNVKGVMLLPCVCVCVCFLACKAALPKLSSKSLCMSSFDQTDWGPVGVRVLHNKASSNISNLAEPKTSCHPFVEKRVSLIP